ncbi:MAG: FtsX-like permease family protein [Enterococcus sp.]
MLWKLSLTGIKGRLRDYIVLFSGLMLSSAIFYMFESLATNEAFLQSNSPISATTMVFQVGSVLLGIITLFYIFYANSFLMAMRQKDYGMFMMLGAKGRKIGQMIFIETFFVGLLATVLGLGLGIGLTTVVNNLLVSNLELAISHYSPFSLKAIVISLIFYAALFLLAAMVNARKIVKQPILKILRSNETPHHLKSKKIILGVEVISGIALLAAGYWFMTQLETMQVAAIFIAMGTILVGSYLMFHSVVIFVLSLLKKSDAVIFKKLTNFTLSQLSFRIRDYTKMLALIAVLFALALGASTAGLGFRNEIPAMTDRTSAYDLILIQPSSSEQADVEELQPTLNQTYHYKTDDTHVYIVKEEYDQKPVIEIPIESFKGELKYEEHNGDDLVADKIKRNAVRELLFAENQTKEMVVLSETEFNQQAGESQSVQVVQVADFMEQKQAIKDLVLSNEENNQVDAITGSYAQKYNAYVNFNSIFSGFEFMGFFLGIAFLTMLASCLMFKILSGAHSDVRRYEMLNKIGTRTELLKQSIRREIGVLFALPAMLGTVHVLFGLQMFKLFMQDPYAGIWIPFAIFFVLYFAYYVLTTWIYTNIVLKKD